MSIITRYLFRPFARLLVRPLLAECPACGVRRYEQLVDRLTSRAPLDCRRCAWITGGYARGVLLFARLVTGDSAAFDGFLRKSHVKRSLGNFLTTIARGRGGTPFVPDAPISVFWHITNRCDKRCAHCYADSGARDAAELDDAGLRAILRQIVAVPVSAVILTGGEALLREAIVLELIADLRRHGAFTILTTHGGLIDPGRAAALKQRGLGELVVSLDGDEAGHDRLRGPGSFRDALRAVRIAADAGLQVGVNIMMNALSFDRIDSMARAAEAAGAMKIYMLDFVPHGRGAAVADELQMTGRQRARAFEQVETLLAERAPSRDRWMQTSACFSPLLAAWQYAVLRREARDDPWVRRWLTRFPTLGQGCGAGLNMCSIAVNGELTPCFHLPYMKAGRLPEQNLHELWHGAPAFVRLRQAYARRCKGCALARVCGGCRGRAADGGRGDLLARDPCCPLAPDMSLIADQQPIRAA
ncbi:MAG: radical SAM protein [Kiritimatiellae bacterium]|nr:radical SAM protein [Kiritimatiellia bacterium]